MEDQIKRYKSLLREAKEIRSRLAMVAHAWSKEEAVYYLNNGFKLIEIDVDCESFEPIYILGFPNPNV